MKHYLFIILLSFSVLDADPSRELVVMTREQFNAATKQVAEEAAKKTAEDNAQIAAANNSSFFPWWMLFNRYTAGGLCCLGFVGLCWRVNGQMVAARAAVDETGRQLDAVEQSQRDEQDAITVNSRRLDHLDAVQFQQKGAWCQAQEAVKVLRTELFRQTTTTFDDLGILVAAAHTGQLRLFTQHDCAAAILGARIGNSSLAQHVKASTAASVARVGEFGDARGAALDAAVREADTTLAQARADGQRLDEMLQAAKHLQRQIDQGLGADISDLQQQLQALTQRAQRLLDDGAGVSAPQLLNGSGASAAAGGSVRRVPRRLTANAANDTTADVGSLLPGGSFVERRSQQGSHVEALRALRND
jgi:hypothetical protein